MIPRPNEILTNRDDSTEIKLPADMTNEELLVEREKADLMIEQLEAAKAMYSEELMDRLNADKATGIVVGDKSVTIVKRYSFKTPISYAQELGATKLVIDSEKLKALVLKGISVPETKISKYILVKTIKGDSE